MLNFKLIPFIILALAFASCTTLERSTKWELRSQSEGATFGKSNLTQTPAPEVFTPRVDINPEKPIGALPQPKKQVLNDTPMEVQIKGGFLFSRLPADTIYADNAQEAWDIYRIVMSKRYVKNNKHLGMRHSSAILKQVSSKNIQRAKKDLIAQSLTTVIVALVIVCIPLLLSLFLTGDQGHSTIMPFVWFGLLGALFLLPYGIPVLKNAYDVTQFAKQVGLVEPTPKVKPTN